MVLGSRRCATDATERLPGRSGAFENDVLHFLNVDVFRFNCIEHTCKHPRSIEMTDDQPVCRRRLARQVYDIRHLAGFFELPNYPHRLSRNRFLRLICRGADVMRPVESFFFNDLVVKLSGTAGWFQRIDVETSANTTIPHGCNECLLVDHLAACSVDEVSTLLHRVEKISVEEMFGFRIQREVNADNV